MSTDFINAARRAFSFLEHAGFRWRQIDPAQLQYATEDVLFTIRWDGRSGELDVSIGHTPRKDQQPDTFSLTDLLAMEGVDVPESKTPFQVADESKLGPFLDKLAADIQVHAQSALTGDRMFFRRLKTFRDTAAEAYMRDMTCSRVRAEANKAWRKRDLDKLITLYTSIEDQLSGSEKKKLLYAKQHQAR